MAILYTDSGSFNNLQVTGSTVMSASSDIVLQLKGSGSTIFSISGSAGEIFNISDRSLGSSTLFSVASGNTTILSVDDAKKVNVSGSFVITGSLTSNTIFETPNNALIISRSSSETSTVLNVIGSGSITPIFSVQGSQGTLFSITDSFEGSLFAVTNKRGEPILDVSSDNTVALGDYSASAVFTTIKKTIPSGGSIDLYNVSKSLYDGIFMDYTIRSSSFCRAGSLIATWSGSTDTDLTEISTIGTGTEGVTLSTYTINTFDNERLVISGSSISGDWTIKAIIRSI